MKHAAAKEKPARIIAKKIEQEISAGAEKKVANKATVLPFRKTKAIKESTVQKIKLKEKAVKAVEIVSKTKTKAVKTPKSKAAKVAPVAVIGGKIEKQKKVDPCFG